MSATECDVVTGAFGYTGRYITQQLLRRGRRVRTLTNHPSRESPFERSIEVAPLDFQDSTGLARALQGVTTLYNTYWVRFAHGDTTFERAVSNTRTLIDTAARAGVQRIVHVSIANPSMDSPLPYFRGKAILEEYVHGSGVSHAILRPTVIFGREDILINNIAWLLRHLRFFAVPGTGRYRLQPIFVEDFAELAVEAGDRREDVTFDTVGPDTFTFDELVALLCEKLGVRCRLVHVPPHLALFAARLIGWIVRDVVLTHDELDGLMADLLVSCEPPTGRTRLADWLAREAGHLGRAYASELRRHYRP